MWDTESVWTWGRGRALSMTGSTGKRALLLTFDDLCRPLSTNCTQTLRSFTQEASYSFEGPLDMATAKGRVVYLTGTEHHGKPVWRPVWNQEANEPLTKMRCTCDRDGLRGCCLIVFSAGSIKNINTEWGKLNVTLCKNNKKCTKVKSIYLIFHVKNRHLNG